MLGGQWALKSRTTKPAWLAGQPHAKVPPGGLLLLLLLPRMAGQPGSIAVDEPRWLIAAAAADVVLHLAAGVLLPLPGAKPRGVTGPHCI